MAILKVRDSNGKIIEIPAFKGKDGKTAYQYAVEKGYIGSESEFAESLYKAVTISSQNSYFGICNDSIDTSNKTVTLENVSNFNLTDNACVIVRFTQGLRTTLRSHNDITLNINNTGNKTLYIWGAVDSSGINDNLDYIVGDNGILILYYNELQDGYVIAAPSFVQNSYVANFAWEAKEAQTVQHPQLFGICNTNVNEATKVIEVDNRFNNFLRDGTRLTIRFTNGLKLLNLANICFNINGIEYPVFYNGVDAFDMFEGDSWLIWYDGILSFIYQDNPDLGQRFVLDGGTEQLLFINDFTNTLDIHGYANPSEFIRDVITNTDNIKKLSSQVNTNKLTATSSKSTDDTLIEPLKVRDDRIDIFKTTRNYGTDSQQANSDIVIKTGESIKIDNIDLILTERTTIDAHKISGTRLTLEDEKQDGLQIGHTLHATKGMIKLGYNPSDDSYYSKIICGQKDNNEDETDAKMLVISTSDDKEGISFNSNYNYLHLFAPQVKISYDGQYNIGTNECLDTKAVDVTNGVKLRAKVNNSNGGRNNLVVEQNDIRICGDIILKDVSTNCTGLYTDVTQEELEFIEGNLQNTLIDLKRAINTDYLVTHPENESSILIPFMYNDIAFLTAKGYTVSAYTTTDTDYTMMDSLTMTKTFTSNIANLFNGTPDYCYFTLNNISDVLVIDMNLPKHFAYNTQFYIDFGKNSWGFKNINIYVMNGLTENAYRLVGSNVKNSSYHHFLITDRTTNAEGTSVQGFNKMRIVLKNPSTTSCRISEIGLINYASSGSSSIYIPKSGATDITGNLIPYYNNQRTLGSASKLWNEIYGNNIYGNTITASTNFLGNLTGIASAARMDEEGNNIINTYATKDELTNYVPLVEWDTYDENADTYFGGYLNMKELADEVNYIQSGWLGRHKYYLGIDELADYSVPSAGWETSDMNHDWYFGGYTDMKELANECHYWFSSQITINGYSFYGIGDLYSDMAYLQTKFLDSSDYVSISEISDEFTNIKETYATKEDMKKYIEETILGGKW